MIYLIPAAFFTGIAIGYIVAALIEDTNKTFKRHEEYLEATRKSFCVPGFGRLFSRKVVGRR